MISSFSEMNLLPPILKALEEMGFEAPTEVQAQSIPLVLNEKDLIVISKTGSGKTAAFGIPILQKTEPDEAGPQALILTPTRELAVQVDTDLKRMGALLKHKTTTVYGQHSINVEIQALKKGVNIVTGTPGRVFDHIQHGNLITQHIRFLVLDEADRMLDMGFIEQVEKIIKTIPRNRVTLLFSATMPIEVRNICSAYMKDPATIEIESQTKTVDTIKQAYYRVEHREKLMHLNHLLLTERPDSCIIFCNTKMGVDRVHNFLLRKGYASHALHGDIPQVKRLKTMNQFKEGEFRLLIATDVAARGIHINDLSLVINFDVPVEKDSYVHRIGRTGRAGNTGRAISLVTSEDIMTLYEIEEHIGALIEEAEIPSQADINNHKDEVEKWIQANRLQIRSPQAVSGNKNAAAPKRPVQPRPQHTVEKTGDPKTTQTGPTQRKPAQNRPYQNKPQELPRQNKPYQERPAVAASLPAKPAAAQPSPAKATPGKPPLLKEKYRGKPGMVYPNSKPVEQKQEPAPKQTILQRMFKSLFGGKKPAN